MMMYFHVVFLSGTHQDTLAFIRQNTLISECVLNVSWGAFTLVFSADYLWSCSPMTHFNTKLKQCQTDSPRSQACRSPFCNGKRVCPAALWPLSSTRLFCLLPLHASLSLCERGHRMCCSTEGTWWAASAYTPDPFLKKTHTPHTETQHGSTIVSL